MTKHIYPKFSCFIVKMIYIYSRNILSLTMLIAVLNDDYKSLHYSNSLL